MRVMEPAQALTHGVLAGRWLIGIAAFHAVFGLWFGREPLLAIVREGLWNTVDLEPARGLIFWFMIMSPLLAMLGQLLISAARSGRPASRWLGWQLLAFALGGAVLMPASGFWLGIVPAALLLRGSRASL